MSDIDEYKLMTETEVAKILRKSVHWMRAQRYKKTNTEIIPYMKIGFDVRYNEKDVLNWLKQREMKK